MKTKAKLKTLVIGMIIMLFANSVIAQKEQHEVTIKLKDIADIKKVFEKSSDCTHCLEPYHFRKSVKQIVWLDEKLKSTGKSKFKKKLPKKVKAFSDNATQESKGILKQISQNVKRSEALEKLLKLQLYVDTVLGIIDPPDRLSGDDDITNARSTLTDVKESIDETLKSNGND